VNDNDHGAATRTSPADPDSGTLSAEGPSGPLDARPESGSAAETDATPHGCTAAQLRRFIKSRPYVPLHELRRRFELGGETDDVWPIDTAQGPSYVGVPRRECALLQELIRQGEIGVELCTDPDVRVVVGIYPIRPVPRT